MKIGKFAQKVHLSEFTLRYYEKIGLLNKISKDESGHRNYTDKDGAWIGFISRLKATDMSLKEIVRFAKLRNKGDKTIPDRYRILKKHRSVLKIRIMELIEHLDQLDIKIAHYKNLLKNNSGSVDLE
jgi:DNA-binding transcriptional MerR regulator